MLLWTTLTLALVALASWRYGAESREGRDRWTRAHTPAADLAAAARAARCALYRIRGVPNEPVRGDAAWRRP